MIKNYFIVAIRNFWRNKTFSFINIASLAIGISAALVIYLISDYEFNFDKFEKNGNRIYRVVTDMSFGGTPFSLSGAPAPLAGAIKREVTGIENTIAFHEFNSDANITVPQNTGQKPQVFKKQPGIIFTDSSYFKLLPYQWLAGSPKTSLNEPFKVVLTEKRAKVYFPNTDFTNVVGKQIIYNDTIPVTISGVIRDLNENTDFIFKEFISLATIPASGLKSSYNWDEWGGVSSNSQLLVKLAKDGSVTSLEAQLKKIQNKYAKDPAPNSKNTTIYGLQPLRDIHFSEKYGTFGDHLAHKPTLIGLRWVALFLLILGCINFINLTTAQASQRAKEIGIRKTMGSSRLELMTQSLNETFLMTLLATVLSILLTPLILEMFSDFIPKDLHFSLLQHPSILVFLGGLIVTVSILSGFYPALVLTKYNPAQVLKNQAHPGTSGTRRALLRKTLTVSQFFIAQVFIIASVITVKQIHFMINTDLGFKKDAIISFGVPFNYNNFKNPDNRRFPLLNDLKSIPGLEMVSLGSDAPSSSGWSFRTMSYKDGKKEIQTDVQIKRGDTNYLKLFHIKLLAGRNVQQSDTTREYIINETYLHTLGFRKPEDALNKTIDRIPIVGVMSDFHSNSLHGLIKPIAFSSEMNFSYNFHLALAPRQGASSSWATTIGKVGNVFRKNYPEEDFSYDFFDDTISKLYTSEQTISRLLKWATALAILISSMGLLGLVIYTTTLRTKEIGVRKVLGASVTQIVSLLSGEFLALVFVAFIVAVPVAWWAMHRWLQGYAYRTGMSWWVFAVTGTAMVVISMVTLSIQTVRSAVANPVESLRTE